MTNYTLCICQTIENPQLASGHVRVRESKAPGSGRSFEA